MVFSPAFTLARVHPLGVWPCVGLRLQSLRQFQVFFASSARQSSASSYGVGSALHSRPIPSPGLTLRSSRPPTAPAELVVSLRKTCIIQPHALFTGSYLFKRLFVGFWVSRRASPWGAAPVQAFLASSPCAASATSYHFSSSASPPWRTAFSRFAPVVNLGLPVLASVANRAVKPTCLRQAAYFRSLAPLKPCFI